MSSRELCIMACVFCRDWAFQDWAHQQIRDRDLVVVNGKLAGHGEAMAKAFILHVCEMSSRNDLDVDAAAAERFHARVRKPFLEWKESS